MPRVLSEQDLGDDAPPASPRRTSARPSRARLGVNKFSVERGASRGRKAVQSQPLDDYLGYSEHLVEDDGDESNSTFSSLYYDADDHSNSNSNSTSHSSDALSQASSTNQPEIPNRRLSGNYFAGKSKAASSFLSSSSAAPLSPTSQMSSSANSEDFCYSPAGQSIYSAPKSHLSYSSSSFTNSTSSSTLDVVLEEAPSSSSNRRSVFRNKPRPRSTLMKQMLSYHERRKSRNKQSDDDDDTAKADNRSATKHIQHLERILAEREAKVDELELLGTPISPVKMSRAKKPKRYSPNTALTMVRRPESESSNASKAAASSSSDSTLNLAPCHYGDAMEQPSSIPRIDLNESESESSSQSDMIYTPSRVAPKNYFARPFAARYQPRHSREDDEESGLDPAEQRPRSKTRGLDDSKDDEEDQQRFSRWRFYLVLVCVGVFLGGIGIGFFVRRKHNNKPQSLPEPAAEPMPENDPEEIPVSDTNPESPSQQGFATNTHHSGLLTAHSLFQRIEPSLYTETIRNIRSEPSSPQAQAMQWLIRNFHDKEHPISTLVQAFAVATLQYSWSLPIEDGQDVCRGISGVYCQNSVVTQLRYVGARSQIKGSIPPEMGLLSHLTDLELVDHPALVGALPPELADLAELRRATVSRTSARGPLPELAWPKLESLDLSRNGLSGAIPEPNLPEARSLDLSRNSLSGPVPADGLALSTRLAWLRLEGNELTGDLDPVACSESLISVSVAADCASDELTCTCCEQCCIAGERCVYQ